VKFNYDIDIT